ncbi:MAG: glycosyltransferase [Planctomycetes bacterium]|nr:glycosyltransferase [Planctomycetota bacterium]
MNDTSLTVGVVVPVYNEIVTVREILRRVAEIPLVSEIVVVDDCSTDGTREVLRKREAELRAGPPPRPTYKFVYQPVNKGKGAALRTGFKYVESDITIVQDADLEYDPRDYPKLVQPILDGDADVVYGSRFAGWPRRVLYFWHAVANRVLTTLSNMATDLNLTDMETCYKVFKTEILRSIPIRSDRFGFEPEITAKVAKLGCRVYEVPISYHGRSKAEGKKIGLKDAFQALWIILKYMFVDDTTTDTAHGTLRLLQREGMFYYKWLFDRIRRWIGNDVLEVGAGVGIMTRFFLGRERVTATDVSPKYLRELQTTLGHWPNVNVRPFDLMGGTNHLPGGYDTVVCLNVLEHVEDDAGALRRMRDVLRPGGRLVLYVPADPRLYCEIDRGVGHYRRYTMEEALRKVREAGFRVLHARHHNTLGAIGWFFNGKILRRKALAEGQVRGFRLLRPLLALDEKFESRFALSVMVVGEKST